jgi:zinc transport system substrate-binding protein
VFQVRSLARQLADADPARAAVYQANSEAFIERLDKLRNDMQEAARHFRDRKVVTFHDAFAYLARDLNLEVVATLAGDPEHMLSARRMGEVIETIKQTGAAAIFCEPAYSDRAARVVGEDTGVPVLTLNPFNTIDGPPTAGSYEQVMRRNLEVLVQALGT